MLRCPRGLPRPHPRTINISGHLTIYRSFRVKLSAVAGRCSRCLGLQAEGEAHLTMAARSVAASVPVEADDVRAPPVARSHEGCSRLSHITKAQCLPVLIFRISAVAQGAGALQLTTHGVAEGGTKGRGQVTSPLHLQIQCSSAAYRGDAQLGLRVRIPPQQPGGEPDSVLGPPNRVVAFPVAQENAGEPGRGGGVRFRALREEFGEREVRAVVHRTKSRQAFTSCAHVGGP